MTARIQRALGNPWVATLNHPHGRLVGSREPYAVDMDAVIATAVEQGIALEINSQPERMDLDGLGARRPARPAPGSRSAPTPTRRVSLGWAASASGRPGGPGSAPRTC